jgi:hypothetical protein
MRCLLLPLLFVQDGGQDEPRVYESMIVPYASTGEPDWAPSAERPRHVINVTLAGELIHHGRVLEDTAAVSKALERIAAEMPQAPLFEGGPPAPVGALLIRADLVGDFAPVLDLIQAGAALRLREYHLAVGDISKPRIGADGVLLSNAGPERYLPLSLPVEAGGDLQAVKTTLGLRVAEPGRRLEVTRPAARPWSGEAGTRFRWDMAQRKVAYSLGKFETQDRTELQKRLFGQRKVLIRAPVQVRVGAGITAAEAMNALDVLRGLGVRDVRLVAQD